MRLMAAKHSCLGSQVVPQPLEERMAHFALRGLGAVLDLGEQLGLNPDRLVRDLLRIGRGSADERRQSSAQLSGRRLVEAMVDLAGVDQVVALAVAECSNGAAVEP